MPAIAAPMQPPMIAVSESGASITRQPGAEPYDRVALGPALEHLLRHVERVGVDGVTLHPQRQALDQRRPAAVARLVDRRLRLSVDGQDVGAVDDHAVEAVPLRAI